MKGLDIYIIPGLIWPKIGVSVIIPFMGRIDLFENYVCFSFMVYRLFIGYLMPNLFLYK